MEPERVTATDKIPPRKTKNPKKVAAGKAAYAARKEKEAKMLENLQNAKKSLRDSPKEFKEPAFKLSVRETKPQKVFIEDSRLSKTTLLWTTGLIGLGAVACYYYFQSKPARQDPRESSHARIFPLGKFQNTDSKTKSHSILKTSPQSNINDPFYMQ